MNLKKEEFSCTFPAQRCKSLMLNGAGEGNRTLVNDAGSRDYFQRRNLVPFELENESKVNGAAGAPGSTGARRVRSRFASFFIPRLTRFSTRRSLVRRTFAAEAKDGGRPTSASYPHHDGWPGIRDILDPRFVELCCREPAAC